MIIFVCPKCSGESPSRGDESACFNCGLTAEQADQMMRAEYKEEQEQNNSERTEQIEGRMTFHNNYHPALGNKPHTLTREQLQDHINSQRYLVAEADLKTDWKFIQDAGGMRWDLSNKGPWPNTSFKKQLFGKLDGSFSVLLIPHGSKDELIIRITELLTSAVEEYNLLG